MSKAYSITYDLKAPGRDYSGMYKAIKSTGTWWHYLESTWLVATDESPSQIGEKLRRHIDQNDRLLIIEIRNNKDGWLSKDAWDWINTHVPSAAYAY